jgi:signal transduction histidine kinase
MVLHLLLEKTVGPLTNEQQELLQMARKEAERLLRILNDLLDLTRLEAGQSALNKERVAPAELVQSILDEAQRRVAERGHALSSSADPQLPAVLVDRQRIGHVFHNFITNAVSHSPPGSDIQLRAARTDDGGIQFSVIDRGPGVPAEYQSRIFERFFRVPGQSRTGAGLGLSIAREIVVAHGGRIGVRSRPKEGSEFYFVLASAEEKVPA